MQVRALRQALGHDAVINVPGRGYRLNVVVRLRASARARSNLPHWPEPLLGRDADLQALAALMDTHRLVTVLGAGGIGKTRLAQQLALQCRDRYRDGAWWVDLASLLPAAAGGADVVAQAAARALEVEVLAAAGGSAVQTLCRTLADWDGLLLLDNAEHLCGAQGGLPPLVRALLAAAPGARLLVTSQQALKLPEEWVYHLDALAVPPLGAPLDQARTCAALQLLERRALAADRRFVLHDADLPVAAALVRQLDGNPLAIEMAAPRLAGMGLAPLMAQLQQRLSLLQGADAACAPRHRTLRAALDWSVDLLSGDERAVLRQLSVFAAAFRLDSACAVAEVPGLDADGLMRVVLSLADKSLLQGQPPEGAGLPRRLRLLESTRLHAAEALRAEPGGAVAAAQQRHARAMARLATQAAQEFHVLSDAAWKARWVPDHDDLMRGFDHAHALGDAESAASIIELLVLGANATGWVEPALARAGASRTLAAGAAPLARARLLGWGGQLQTPGLSRLAAAAQRVQVWRAVTGDAQAQGLCTALAMQALANEEAGDTAAADGQLAECLQLEDPRWSARLRRRCSWLVLSRMSLLRDDPALGERADQLSQRLALQLEQLGAWRELALVQTHVAQRLRSRGLHREAVTLWSRIGQSMLASGCLVDAGVNFGLTAVALVELADTAPGDAGLVDPAPDDAPLLLREAGQAAAQALPLLAPLPGLARHLLPALSRLACRLGDAEQAAMLLAGWERLCRDMQFSALPQDLRTLHRVRAELDARLDAATRSLAEERGRRLDGEALRQLSLQWLQAQCLAPGPGPAAGPLRAPSGPGHSLGALSIP
jgi:predicted ATPase